MAGQAHDPSSGSPAGGRPHPRLWRPHRRARQQRDPAAVSGCVRGRPSGPLQLHRHRRVPARSTGRTLRRRSGHTVRRRQRPQRRHYPYRPGLGRPGRTAGGPAERCSRLGGAIRAPRWFLRGVRCSFCLATGFLASAGTGGYRRPGPGRTADGRDRVEPAACDRTLPAPVRRITEDLCQNRPIQTDSGHGRPGGARAHSRGRGHGVRLLRSVPLQQGFHRPGRLHAERVHG